MPDAEEVEVNLKPLGVPMGFSMTWCCPLRKGCAVRPRECGLGLHSDVHLHHPQKAIAIPTHRTM